MKAERAVVSQQRLVITPEIMTVSTPNRRSKPSNLVLKKASYLRFSSMRTLSSLMCVRNSVSSFQSSNPYRIMDIHNKTGADCKKFQVSLWDCSVNLLYSTALHWAKTSCRMKYRWTFRPAGTSCACVFVDEVVVIGSEQRLGNDVQTIECNIHN